MKAPMGFRLPLWSPFFSAIFEWVSLYKNQPNLQNQEGGNDHGYKKVNVGSLRLISDLGLGSWGCRSGGGRNNELQVLHLRY